MQRDQGEYTFENGAIYCGQWLGRYRHGYGKQTWPDGARYEGEWLNNKAHGRGIFYHVDGDIFDGEWKNDKANGYGTYYNVNGSKYEGQWVDDLQEGFGKETWKRLKRRRLTLKSKYRDGYLSSSSSFACKTMMLKQEPSNTKTTNQSSNPTLSFQKGIK